MRNEEQGTRNWGAARPGVLGVSPRARDVARGLVPRQRGAGDKPPRYIRLTPGPRHIGSTAATGHPLAGVGTQIHFQGLLGGAQLGAEAQP